MEKFKCFVFDRVTMDGRDTCLMLVTNTMVSQSYERTFTIDVAWMRLSKKTIIIMHGLNDQP